MVDGAQMTLEKGSARRPALTDTHRFNVETDGGDRLQVLAQFKFVEDGGLAGSVETE